ncbi:MAG: C_GCAxxG_C_C family protein [Chloroflexi bacterium]|nr:C_GCAxxG_C_C family protein [Chloroflexota bacterium]
MGLDEPTALKIASGFGGGCAGLGLTCGAVSGAFMVIGLQSGHVRGDDAAAKQNTQALIRRFGRQFIARNKSLNCTELLGCDLGAPGGLEQARSQNLFTTICPKLVRDAAEILEEMNTAKPVTT